MHTCETCGIKSHNTICPRCFELDMIDNISDVRKEVDLKPFNTNVPVPDKINHIEPSHYTDMKISPIEYIEANPHLTWSLSNCIKYISRAGLKANNPKTQDLKKALWYLQHEIDRLEKSP